MGRQDWGFTSMAPAFPTGSGGDTHLELLAEVAFVRELRGIDICGIQNRS